MLIAITLSFSRLYPFCTKLFINTADKHIAPNASNVWYPCNIPSLNTFSMAASFKFPIGFIIPITIKANKQTNNAGVKYEPIISTTLDGFIVKANVIAKNIVENNTALNPGISGIIPISKVVAAVLGIARSGPKHIIIAEPKIIANNLPALPNTLPVSPSDLADANIASSDKPTSAIINPKNPIKNLSPVITPK